MIREEKLWFQQEILIEKTIDQERFLKGLERLLPDAKDGAAAIWAEFARECVESEQYVDFTAEPDETALCRWHDTLLAGFVLVADRFSRETAAEVCNLSLNRCCLYPWEMERAAEELEKGTSPDVLSHLMEDGKLEANAPVFPKLKKALDIADLSQDTHLNMTFGQ